MTPRAQSESIGVILLVGVVVVSVSTVGAYALSDIENDRVHVDATIEMTEDQVTAGHAGEQPAPHSD